MCSSQPRMQLNSLATPCPLRQSAFTGAQLSSPALRSRRSGNHRVLTVCMASKVKGYIKLALEAGKANPSPPVGPALGAKGVNIMQFCKEYNSQTQDKAGSIIPVEITVYEDRSFTFILKTPPASSLLKKAANVTSGSGTPQSVKVGSITKAQLKEIAEIKMPDLNSKDIEAAMRVVEGTARNMGITVDA